MQLTKKEQSIIKQLLNVSTFTGSSINEMYNFKQSLDEARILEELELDDPEA